MKKYGKKNTANNCKNWNVLNLKQDSIREGKPFVKIRYWNFSESVKLIILEVLIKIAKNIKRWFLVKNYIPYGIMFWGCFL